MPRERHCWEGRPTPGKIKVYMAKLFKYEKIILQELKEKGYKYKDVMDIYHENDIEEEVINVILKWLPGAYTDHHGTADILVRSLIGAKEPFDPSILIKLFDEADLNFSLKDGIARALIYSKTEDISHWLKDQLLNKDYALERITLVEGLNNKGRFKTEKELMDFVKKIFPKYHDEEVLKLFRKFGDQNDILFLRNEANIVDDKIAKQIEKVISAIAKRLSVT